jgi:hypothetical protein
MDQTRVNKNVLKNKPEGSRKVGRFKLNWMDDEENDFQELKAKKTQKKKKKE